MAFTATTSNSATAWRPDKFVFDAADIVPDALILNHSIVAGEIQGDQPALRVAYPVDDDAQFVPEGDEIPEGEPELNEAVIYTAKFAQLLRISNEQYRQTNTAEQLATSVARAMTKKCDAAFIAEEGPSEGENAPVAGLVNTEGIETASVGKNLDSLVDLQATVQSNGADPTAWLISPDGWARISKMKVGGSNTNANLLGAGVEAGERRLLGTPIVISAAVPSETGLLVDRNAIISAASQLEVATSTDSYFSSDSVGVRATWRTGHVLARPSRIGHFDFASS